MAGFTNFCCRSGGSNLNAGTRTGDSTVPGTAADLTYASGSWVSSTGVFTVASGDPVADGVAVGDFASVYADGASVTTLVGRVTARTTTTITVSTTIKSGTTTDGAGSDRTLKIGGAWAGPSGTDGFPLSFLTSACTNTNTLNRINMRNDATYSITAAITGSTASFIQGFTTAYEDGGRFILDGGTTGASYILLTLGTNVVLLDAILQNNGATGSAGGLQYGTRSRCGGVVVHDVRGNGFTMSGTEGIAYECEAYLCNQSNAANGGFQTISAPNQFLIRCVSHDNTGVGFSIVQQAVLIKCRADSNSGRGYYNSSFMNNCHIYDSEFYNNGSHGVDTSGFCIVENCNFVKNGGWGFQNSTSSIMRNCGYGAGTQANTSGTRSVTAALIESGSVTYTANETPWVDPANGDFRINHASAKGAGRGVFVETQASYGDTTGYPDIGAAQHLETGSVPAMSMGGLVARRM